MNNLFDLFRLSGKTIWVAGGAGYLGQTTVKMLLDAGANVLCMDLAGKADDFVASLPQANEKATSATLDVRDGEAIKKFVAEKTIDGVPDGLVILTFGSASKNFEDLTEKDFDDVNHAGLTATFLLAREVGQAMEKVGRGSIVLFSSMYGSVSPDPRVYEAPMNVNPIEYGVGKAGIVQMTRYMAVHWAKKNIRCNCISPGPFPSPAVQEKNKDFVERLAYKVPMGRVGLQHEVAGAVCFFISDASSFVTGQNLFVDGGWTSW
ncbi:SDR family oxidoreductase [Flavisolibacter ginsenosidimutans]|uniref:SDR family oxidoreductase n=1 Tax=Flavisolibacter ginsenosidimutans TaxID=661481 RepID=A0A5B8UCZ6_9BACT|nr:SDR family oxidoreductase [Flavisolibacter ginsenosidimutans]QEC54368.1 SDR family oxidoreductase [Flavisolibacter ginsenosidimutans]